MYRFAIRLFLVVGLLFSVTAAIRAHEDDPGWLRVAQYAWDAPAVDVYVDGEVVAEAVEAGFLSDFWELAAGEHSVAFAPSGAGIEDAIVGPVEVNLEADHRVSVSVIGQAGDDSLTPLVIDETAEMADCDLSQNVFRILINNIAGAPAVSIYENDMWIERNVDYGTYSALCVEPFFWDTGKTVLGDDLDGESGIPCTTSFRSITLSRKA